MRVDLPWGRPFSQFVSERGGDVKHLGVKLPSTGGTMPPMCRIRIWFCVLLLTASTGCASRWRPTLEHVRPEVRAGVIDLAPYWNSMRDQRLTFVRTEPESPDVTPEPFQVELHAIEANASMLVQGAFAGPTPGSLRPYFPREAEADGPTLAWPVGDSGGGCRFFMEFDPPITYLPATLTSGQPSTWAADLNMYNQTGRLRMRGTVQREVGFEGYETVTAGGETYRSCARLCIRTICRIHWGPVVELNEYLWLAPDVGLVRRLERISGFVWLVYFRGVYLYELKTRETIGSGGTRAGTIPPMNCAAVWLDRMFPRPRIGGVMAEFRDQTAPAISLVGGGGSSAGNVAGPGSSMPP